MHLPLVHWAHWGLSAEEGHQKAAQGAQLLGLTAPLWPAQGNQDGAPPAAGLDAFFAAAGPRASLYRWPDPADEAQATAMEALTWTN